MFSVNELFTHSPISPTTIIPIRGDHYSSKCIGVWDGSGNTFTTLQLQQFHNEEDENEPSEVPAVSYKLSYMHRSNYDGATQGLSSE